MTTSSESGRAAAERLVAARREFDSEVTYLDTATMGLPPRRTVEVVERALDRWRRGIDDAVAYDDAVEASRRSYAELVGVDASWVATGSQVSSIVGMIASSLPAGSEVLTAEGDFTSVLFPFHAQQRHGITVREAPLERLADAVDSNTRLVAVSAVQSSDGRVADLDTLVEACETVGAETLVDTTQAVGWLPIDARRFSYTTGGGYKWLLAPRGTAFLTVRPDLMDRLRPVGAGWYAGEDRWSSIYGTPLRLASTARRFDVSPAWHAWVGQATSLEVLLSVGTSTLHDHGVGLANRFRDALGLPPGDSAIQSLDTGIDAVPALTRAGIKAAGRSGRLRLSFHLCNDDDDVDRAVEALHAMSM